MLNVNKMIITAFKEVKKDNDEKTVNLDKSWLRVVPVLLPPYVAHVNPESYSITDKTCYTKTHIPGRIGNLLSFNAIKPSELSFEFLFDATGALGADTLNSTMGVTGRISRFLEIVKDPHDQGGDGSEPFILLLTWGQLAFFCKMTSLTLNYKMFNPFGIPIRATAEVSFQRVDAHLFKKGDFLKKVSKEKKIELKETLGKVSRVAYGSTDQLIRVAKSNKLKSIKNIKPGKKLILPPL